jgi:hypothetical protein
MLFTIQTYIEEYLNKRNMKDPDGYAVRLANLYFYHRTKTEDTLFLTKIRRIRTVIFVNNNVLNRNEFELSLIHRLDNRFKKKLDPSDSCFPGGVEKERERLKRIPKLTIDILLNEFSHAIEARAIDAFWVSRNKNKIRSRPEKIAQSLLAVFTLGTLIDRNGIVMREFLSGIGFVDLGIMLSTTLHLVEIKILQDGFTGPNQLSEYMKKEKRREGSLLIFDARKSDKKVILPMFIKTKSGLIKVYQVDINPIPPSKLN